LLSRDADTPYEVLDSIDLDYHPDRKALNEKLYKQNTQVLSSAKQLDVSKLTTREISAQRYPWLSFSADYNYLQNNYTAGTNSLTRNYGPVLGGSLTLPIYDGHRIHRLVKISKLEQQAASYDLENTRLQANTDLQNALSAYERVLQLLNLEKSNLILAKENLDITMRRLQLGQTTSLEVRQAEESYIQSLTRQILFKYSAKSLETKLRQLVSEL